MDIDALHLKTLAAIVDEGSLERAAVALVLTPSAVSQRLKAMERQVGRILLQRTRPPQPTASGKLLLRMARQIGAPDREAIDQLGLATRPATTPLGIQPDTTWKTRG